MNLTCYLIADDLVDIRPSRNRRSWMDQIPSSYRCLPLSIANSHGWEIRCPVTCEAEWNGGSKTDDFRITFEGGGNSLTGTVKSHFGSGILTFQMGAIISTCPGYDLWGTGPVNECKDGIQALSAIIETYWMPFTFTMNWKFTRPNMKVRFDKDEPFCFFFPIEHGLLKRINPVFKKVSEHPEIEKQYRVGMGKRSFLRIVRSLKGQELKERDLERLRWQGWYMKGEMPDDTEVADHQKRIKPKPFKHGR
jgi:Family of unknown function (DUF6065)